MSRRLTTIALLSLAACVRTPPGTVPAARPAPVATTAAPVTPATRWAVTLAPGSVRYLVSTMAAIELAGDTAHPRDTVRSAMQATLRLTSAPAGARVAVTIDSFEVSAGRAGTTQRPLTQPASFEALLDTAARRVSLTGAAATAASAADCGSPARTLVASARDLVVPLPRLLERGARWEDSTVAMTCRGEIPLTVLATHRYEVEGSDTTMGAAAIRIRRTTRSTLSGTASPRGQQVTITGDGNSESRLWVDPARGRLLAATGEAETKLKLEAAGQTREFTQRATQDVRLVP